MRAHYLQHVPFEGLGSIEKWLRNTGYEITYTQFFGSAALPELGDIDFLLVMGGPMSVNDEDCFPWLAAEKQFIHDAITTGKPVLGICLGAQLIASAMGARVYPNREKEIGWFPIYPIQSADASVFCFPPAKNVFHWHGETFDLPSGAVHLARSEACLNQAFQIGTSVIGLQFHLETTPAAARQMVTHCRDELKPSKFVMDESAILTVSDKDYLFMNKIMADVLVYMNSTMTR